MIIKTVLHLPVCVWFVSQLILYSSAVQRKYGQRVSSHPTTSRLYIDLRTRSQTALNTLALSTMTPIRVTFRPGGERRRNAVKFGIQTTRNGRNFKISEIDRTISAVNTKRPAVTRSAFIEVNVRRAFVPKRVQTTKLRSVLASHKPVKTRPLSSATVPEDFNKTMYENDTESDSGIDTKVFDKLQQLENTLTLMRNQVKNDKQTIDRLKSKMIQKDNELSELNFTDVPPLRINNKNNDAFKSFNTEKEDLVLFSSTLRKGWGQFMSTVEQRITETTDNPYNYDAQLLAERSGVQVFTNKKDSEEGKIDLAPDPFIRDSDPEKDSKKVDEIELRSPDFSGKRGADNIQPNNLNKLPSPNITEIEEPQNQYSNDNSSEAQYENVDYKEGDGQVQPGDDRFSPMRNNFMNSEEYNKKLHEEQIDNGIDWKTFDAQKFLDQMDAEIQESSKAPIKNRNVPSIAQKSGRRMISNDALQIPNVENDDYEDNLRHQTGLTENNYAPFPPRQRTVALNNNFALPTSPSLLSFSTQLYDEPLPEIPHKANNMKLAPVRPRLAPQPGKQEITADSTEILIRNVLGKMNKGRAVGKQPYDFDVIKQKIHREGNKRREMIRKRIAERMTKKRETGRRNIMTKKIKSGRRNMNPVEDVHNYDTNELFKDPFLNDSYV